MRVLVTGAGGQLGYDVCRELDMREIENIGIDIEECDLCDEVSVKRVVSEYAPDIIVHCAAYTAVDKAEQNADICRNINVDATRNIANVARALNSKLCYISTDYVFDGNGDTPFETTTKKAPQNVYGQTKSAGEDVVLSICDKYYIIRTSWVFGINGNNFINTMLKLGKEKQSISVVSDQIGSPTYTFDLSKLICDMIVTEQYGIYHATNEGFCSWFDFATAIMQEAALSCRILPVLTSDYKSDAKRPLNSRMSKRSLDAAGFSRLPPWRDALARYLKEKMSDN